jgi:uncharacterized membrane protein
MNHQLVLSSALAAALSLGAAVTAHAADGDKEKCYGVAKAGKNDCANTSGTHSCAGQSKMDNSPEDWKYVAKGSCEKMGGKMMAPAKK